MENKISGEIYIDTLKKIKEILKNHFDIPIREKSLDEIQMESLDTYLSIYKYSNEIFLIGGTFLGDYYQGVKFVNEISSLLLKEQVYFEIELASKVGNLYIKNKNMNI